MKTLKSTLTFLFAIAILSITVISCSKASVADEDALYDIKEGIDRTKIWVPTNG
ncbi:hypothetical protein [Robertkochia marina]|uniref:hypothetical protein n=1 Tax=Robertkochia marina TaxID=1227945 RepID=UPI001454C45D|nr:hypothetical protein [Robertkochia marina]